MVSWRRPTLITLGFFLALVAAACSVEDALPLPDCATGDSGIIVAQSVPSAAVLPCFDGLPDGWEHSTVKIDEDGTVIHFDSDRAGDDAATLRFTKECDMRGVVQVPSGEPDVARFDFIEQVTPRFVAWSRYLFEGGCVSWEFDFDEGAPASLSLELADRTTFFTRAALNELMAESFIDVDI